MFSSFYKQGIVFSFFALEYEVEKIKNLPFIINAVKPNFVAIYVFFLIAASLIEIISSYVTVAKRETIKLVSLQLLGGE